MTDSDSTIKKQLEEVRKERDQYRSELEKSASDFARYKKHIQKNVPPLLIASVSRIIDNKNNVIIHTPSGNDFLVPNPFKNIQPGDTVGVDQGSIKIIRILPPNVDRFVAGMELDDKPKETYADIGGLDNVIQQVRESIELPLTNPDLFRDVGITPPGGVLLEGPPGTGKTLVARAVANATNASFIRLVGSELIQKFIGEGARLVRELFALARDKAPVVLFIDEIDAVASKRTQDSQVSDREVQRTLMQLMAEMDGFNPLDDVKVIGATNRPDILDPAILRPGRFDRIIHFELPTSEGREEIFKIHSRNMPVNNIDFNRLSKQWEEDLSGASIKAICTEAGMNAIRENRRTITTKDFKEGYKLFMHKTREKQKAAPVYS
ncbi:MAG: AAA family ATPase [archaeon]|nr:AAA family ATPase [archaeon]